MYDLPLVAIFFVMDAYSAFAGYRASKRKELGIELSYVAVNVGIVLYFWGLFLYPPIQVLDFVRDYSTEYVFVIGQWIFGIGFVLGLLRLLYGLLLIFLDSQVNKKKSPAPI